MGIDGALQLKVTLLNRFAGNLKSMRRTLGIDERSVLATLYAQLLNIDLALLDLGRETETIALNQQMSILENHSITAIDEILCGFAETAAGIDITADGAGTLLSQQGLEVSMLANEFVAGREVEDDVCTREGEIIAGRDGCPYIFADLHTELHAIGSDKEFGFSTDRDRGACEIENRRIPYDFLRKPILLSVFSLYWRCRL